MTSTKPLVLPEGFVFSQSSLQDFSDCARRFELRYLRHCRWPAPHTKDALLWEQVTERGFAFHRLLRQFHSGVAAELLEPVAAADPDLLRWWIAYREQPPTELPREVRLSEVTLQAKMGSFRIEARYDLLAGDPGKRWCILDWKTNAHRSDGLWLARRLQTKVYPWILVSAGEQLNARAPIQPEQVEMCYWFAEFPAQPERYLYTAQQYESDGEMLSELLADIAGRAHQAGHDQGGDNDPFPRTSDQTNCRFCIYRSLCWDTVQAGALSELEQLESEEPAPSDLDMDTLTPIPF